jgi:hypothetical protein
VLAPAQLVQRGVPVAADHRGPQASRGAVAVTRYYAPTTVFITPMRRLLAILLVLLAPATAHAGTIDTSRHLWATVNICDTTQSPDTVGIRASMPGTAKKGERMFMRFRVQYLSTVDNLWHNFLAEGTDSGFVAVGKATFKARQSGWSFPFMLEPGQSYELRGVVNFQWRKGGKVVRKSVKRTSKGHKTALSQPKGYSAASCVIKG